MASYERSQTNLLNAYAPGYTASINDPLLYNSMRSLNIAFIIDPLHMLHPSQDTTLALMQEAQQQGGTLFYATLSDLFLADHDVKMTARAIQLFDNADPFYAFLTPAQTFSLRHFDVIWMRKDPPVNTAYLYSTYLLALAVQQGARIINDPTALHSMNEKLLVTYFPQCCPPHCVTSKKAVILDFLAHYSPIVLKPLDNRGGQGIFFLQSHDYNVHTCIEWLTENQTLPIMVQQYLPDILSTGDRRILMIDGIPYSHALVRLPKSGDFRGNLSAGASHMIVPLRPRDYWIAEQVAPTLIQNRLFFVGLDVIGDYLTEINITSPTGVREIETDLNVNLCRDIWSRLLLSLR